MHTHFIAKWLVILGGLIVTNTTVAQTEPNMSTTNRVIGSAGTSLFTGRMTYSIPIYTIEDPDFHLDITLRYHSDGFKPFKPSGCYGQDWELVAGGRITRVVQGFPDEQKIEYFTGNGGSINTLIGMKHAFLDGDIPDKDIVYNMQPPIYDPVCGIILSPDPVGPCWWDRDYMPDIFSFNFMGYEGRFIINNQGKPTIISGDFVDIDLSKLSETYNSYGENSDYSPQSDSLQITIKTTNGYNYIFGGKNAVEYNTICNNNYQSVPSIDTWHLTRIIAPNGRTISIDYAPDIYYSLDYKWEEDDIPDSLHIMHTYQYRRLVRSITLSDTEPLTVLFKFSNEEHKMFEDARFACSRFSLKLDSITVNTGNRRILTANMNYSYRRYDPTYGISRNYYWRYLSSVHITGRGTYNLVYSNIDLLPDSVPSILHLFTYPCIGVTSNEQYKDLVDRRGFWKQNSLQGMLSRVSLPTGGKIKFTYGNHQYGEERLFRAVGNQDIEFYSRPADNQPIGGARIEKIETFSDDSTLVETKTYSYTKQGTTGTSGIYYNIYEIYYPSNPNKGYPIANPFNYGMVDSHIGYSSVTQTTTVGSQTYKTAYTFDTGYNFYTSVGNNLINKNYNTDNYSDTTELCSGSLTYDGKIGITGKLLAIDQYKGNSMLKSTRFKYNGMSLSFEGVDIAPERTLGNTDTIVCFSKYSGHVARKLIVCPDILEAVATYEYDSEGEVMISATAYSYDSKLRKKSSIMQNSIGAKFFSQYTYPDDLHASYGTALNLLEGAHRISEPVEIISGFTKDGVDYITSGTINLYERGTEYYIVPNHAPHIEIPDSLWTHPSDSLPVGWGDSINLGGTRYYPYLYQTRTLALTRPIPLASYQPMSYQNSSALAYDSLYRLSCEYTYDTKNRLISIKPFGATETRYTWDGIYPVSKTIGNQTTSYTYIPYVGVSSVTDPRGITTYYSYDTAGRLIETYQIENERKRILQVYQYHTKTEQP